MRALVCGAGGFIGHHLTRRLVADGHWVRGVDSRPPEFDPTPAHEFLTLDLREARDCSRAVVVDDGFDVVFQLAADMGGMGFIEAAECEIMRNNALINLNVTHAAAAASVGRYFLASSVCVYRDMATGESELIESDAYPALPDNEYGWEKLYAERSLQAYGRRHGLTVRIARFQNCYGPLGTWRGGREKAPAAICRKVAEAPEGGTIEAWGDGSAVRSYVYVEDLVDGVVRLVNSNLEGPVNIGSDEYVSVSELIDLVRSLSGKTVDVRYVSGPVGVRSRNFSHDRIHSLGWRAAYSLKAGLAETYAWIETQVTQQPAAASG